MLRELPVPKHLSKATRRHLFNYVPGELLYPRAEFRYLVQDYLGVPGYRLPQDNLGSWKTAISSRWGSLYPAWRVIATLPASYRELYSLLGSCHSKLFSYTYVDNIARLFQNSVILSSPDEVNNKLAERIRYQLLDDHVYFTDCLCIVDSILSASLHLSSLTKAELDFPGAPTMPKSLPDSDQITAISDFISKLKRRIDGSTNIQTYLRKVKISVGEIIWITLRTINNLLLSGAITPYAVYPSNNLWVVLRNFHGCLVVADLKWGGILVFYSPEVIANNKTLDPYMRNHLKKVADKLFHRTGKVILPHNCPELFYTVVNNRMGVSNNDLLYNLSLRIVNFDWSKLLKNPSLLRYESYGLASWLSDIPARKIIVTPNVIGIWPEPYELMSSVGGPPVGFKVGSPSTKIPELEFRRGKWVTKNTANADCCVDVFTDINVKGHPLTVSHILWRLSTKRSIFWDETYLRSCLGRDITGTNKEIIRRKFLAGFLLEEDRLKDY